MNCVVFELYVDKTVKKYRTIFLRSEPSPFIVPIALGAARPDLPCYKSTNTNRIGGSYTNKAFQTTKSACKLMPFLSRVNVQQ